MTWCLCNATGYINGMQFGSRQYNSLGYMKGLAVCNALLTDAV